MKKILPILLLCFLMSCNNSGNTYNDVLKGLEYNYTKDRNLIESRIYCGSYENKRITSDSLTYIKTLKKFYTSDITLIDYLLKFKADTLRYCYWVSSTDLCSATIDRNSFITRSKGSLILIDNYLMNSNHDTIIIPGYIDRIDYDYIEKNIYDKKSKEKTKEKYNKYIEDEILR